ncbi:MAG: hypothetical protein ACUVRC_10515 [Desulfotomaculales bacterium]
MWLLVLKDGRRKAVSDFGEACALMREAAEYYRQPVTLVRVVDGIRYVLWEEGGRSCRSGQEKRRSRSRSRL